ncbi:hypothetical protein Xen7305DRAFT_00033480 [Xenococcus sp. PCC 7305]|uniref:hypothetical protein n=1 Tax=Xenococcus sp. PCC 7305 TaxID=102125 RepID=UPI0002ACB84E|nr:hypothetical protein [Xenococcus sp. PCC 7305]ELS03624.1 hypothetical protein Xen7305DRAFT_00033480 [Xenococcus sp. PCC 7305]
MRKITILLSGMFMGLIPMNTVAHTNDYPVSSRAIFLSGCLLENKELDFNNDQEVYSNMRICTCLLDQFQIAYSNTEFMELFAGATENKEPQTQELEEFTKKHVIACL